MPLKTISILKVSADYIYSLERADQGVWRDAAVERMGDVAATICGYDRDEANEGPTRVLMCAQHPAATGRPVTAAPASPWPSMPKGTSWRPLASCHASCAHALSQRAVVLARMAAVARGNFAAPHCAWRAMAPRAMSQSGQMLT